MFAVGKKPSKHHLSDGSPLCASAHTAAHAPGTGTTGMPASWHRSASSSPGSLTAGIPASVTSAHVSPRSMRCTSSGPRCRRLCS